MDKNKQNTFKNGGFPPIRYCPVSDEKEKPFKTTKERFFANTPKQNINVRQLLSDSQKKPIIIPETYNDEILEVVDNL
jgi:hypothetical protein